MSSAEPSRGGRLRAAWRCLLRGHALPDGAWRQRHRGVVALLWLHAVGAVAFGVATGAGLAHGAACIVNWRLHESAQTVLRAANAELLVARESAEAGSADVVGTPAARGRLARRRRGALPADLTTASSFMDCHMPVMDGFEATRILRVDGCRVPIIAFTADAVADNRERCVAAGMDDCVTKPVSAAALDEALLRWTGPGVARPG